MSIALLSVLWVGGLILGAGSMMLLVALDQHREGNKFTGMWIVPGCLLMLGLYMSTTFFTLVPTP